MPYNKPDYVTSRNKLQTKIVFRTVREVPRFPISCPENIKCQAAFEQQVYSNKLKKKFAMIAK